MPDIYVPVHALSSGGADDHGAGFSHFAKAETVQPVCAFEAGRQPQERAGGVDGPSRKALAAQYPDTNRERTITVLTFADDRYEQDKVDAILA